MPASDPVLDFMRLLWAVDHGLQSMSKRMMRTHGVTGPQRLVVRLLGRAPEISPGGLATALHLHPSTVTGILQRLEEQGMIERRPDPRDQRRALCRLTRRGEVVDRLKRGTAEAAVRRALRRVPKETVGRAEELLGAILAELEAACARPPRRRRRA